MSQTRVYTPKNLADKNNAYIGELRDKQWIICNPQEDDNVAFARDVAKKCVSIKGDLISIDNQDGVSPASQDEVKRKIRASGILGDDFENQYRRIFEGNYNQGLYFVIQKLIFEDYGFFTSGEQSIDIYKDEHDQVCLDITVTISELKNVATFDPPLKATIKYIDTPHGFKLESITFENSLLEQLCFSNLNSFANFLSQIDVQARLLKNIEYLDLARNPGNIGLLGRILDNIDFSKCGEKAKKFIDDFQQLTDNDGSLQQWIDSAFEFAVNALFDKKGNFHPSVKLLLDKDYFDKFDEVILKQKILNVFVERLIGEGYLQACGADENNKDKYQIVESELKKLLANKAEEVLKNQQTSVSGQSSQVENIDDLMKMLYFKHRHHGIELAGKLEKANNSVLNKFVRKIEDHFNNNPDSILPPELLKGLGITEDYYEAIINRKPPEKNSLRFYIEAISSINHPAVIELLEFGINLYDVNFNNDSDKYLFPFERQQLKKLKLGSDKGWDGVNDDNKKSILDVLFSRNSEFSNILALIQNISNLKSKTLQRDLLDFLRGRLEKQPTLAVYLEAKFAFEKANLTAEIDKHPPGSILSLQLLRGLKVAEDYYEAIIKQQPPAKDSLGLYIVAIAGIDHPAVIELLEFGINLYDMNFNNDLDKHLFTLERQQLKKLKFESDKGWGGVNDDNKKTILDELFSDDSSFSNIYRMIQNISSLKSKTLQRDLLDFLRSRLEKQPTRAAYLEAKFAFEKADLAVKIDELPRDHSFKTYATNVLNHITEEKAKHPYASADPDIVKELTRSLESTKEVVIHCNKIPNTKIEQEKFANVLDSYHKNACKTGQRPWGKIIGYSMLALAGAAAAIVGAYFLAPVIFPIVGSIFGIALAKAAIMGIGSAAITAGLMTSTFAQVKLFPSFKRRPTKLLADLYTAAVRNAPAKIDEPAQAQRPVRR